MMLILLLLLVSGTTKCWSSNRDDLFELSVVHLNDFHARYDEVSRDSSGACRPQQTTCIGGLARVATLIRQLRTSLPNPIVMNAGDNYQGTLYHNEFGHRIAVEMLKMLDFDIYTLGNHEFDQKVAGLVPFLQGLAGHAPTVVANINHSAHPELDGLYQKSVVLEVGGKRIGIVGVINDRTNELSNTERLVFLDDSESVNAEATRLKRDEHVFTVIVLSHCGFENDIEIARKAVPSISLIVGAHSHTLLYTGDPPHGIAHARYPSLVKRAADGGDVLVVQASCYTQYVGAITVSYNAANGRLVRWSGKPQFVDVPVEKAAAIEEALLPYRQRVNEIAWSVLGETEYVLDQTRCRSGECTLGDMLTDAMLYGTSARISFLNSGGIRTSIGQGEIYYIDVVTTQPFGNTADSGTMSGSAIRKCLEQMATDTRSFSSAYAPNVNMLQLSGLRVTLDLAQPEGSRVTTAEVAKPMAEGEYEPLNDSQVYDVIVNSFLVTGGDGFTCFLELDNHRVGTVDVNVTIDYMEAKGKLEYVLQDRITVVNRGTPATLRHNDISLHLV